jgi:hypothetical protein
MKISPHKLQNEKVGPDIVNNFQKICKRELRIIEMKPEKLVFLGKTRGITSERQEGKITNKIIRVR